MNNRTFRRRFRNLSVLCALLFFFAPHPSRAYSFLTHESIIDLAWDPAIKPLLLKRYPHTTATGLRIAHGYAYGGSTIQDAGYYPFGKDFFSDLTHYVRTGAFVTALLRDSRNVDEFAFALGALSHYVGDAIGHSYAVNPAVAIEFPGLHRQYGKIITYEDSPHSHVRTEFAFDIDQLSKDRFAPTAYLRSVGMYVPRRLMNQAFYETYGLSLRSVLGNERVAFRGYRSSVRQFLTRVAYAEVLLHRKRMPPDVNTPQFREFQARLQTAGQQNHWQRFRTHHIGFSTRFYAFLILIVPKVGSLSDLSIRGPNQATEQRYIYSVNDAVDEYDFLIGTIGRVGVRNFSLPNLDLPIFSRQLRPHRQDLRQTPRPHHPARSRAPRARGSQRQRAGLLRQPQRARHAQKAPPGVASRPGRPRPASSEARSARSLGLYPQSFGAKPVPEQNRSRFFRAFHSHAIEQFRKGCSPEPEPEPQPQADATSRERRH